MTTDKQFKQSVRARMEDTGEPYSVARRMILMARGADHQRQLPDTDPAADEAADGAGWRSVPWSAPKPGQENGGTTDA